jgi:hypothetical protein
MKRFKEFVWESMQREAFIFKAKDGKWYYFIAHTEHGEYPNGNTYGPFSSDKESEKHMLSNHSNPGGFHIDKSGKRDVPKNVQQDQISQMLASMSRRRRY